MTRHLVRCLAPLLAGALSLAAGSAAYADGLPGEPLARYQEPLCPGVIGMQVAAAEQIVGRIRANAAEFDLRLAEPATCKPNLLVMFLANGRDYLKRLVDSRPYLFEGLSGSERSALLDDSGPVHVWTNTEVRTRDGIYVGERRNLAEIPQAGMWSAHSRIYLPVRRDILSVIVLFDSGAISAMSLDQLADYATLRSLADAYPAEAGVSRPSILTLFQTAEPDARGKEEAAPTGLTPFDQAFLTRLYASPPNLPASALLKDVPEMAERGE